MNKEEVIALIKVDFPDAEILVDGEDCNFACVVISPVFEGMGLMQKQKAILATVKAQITRGELHAMSVKAHTPEQWAKMQVAQPSA